MLSFLKKFFAPAKEPQEQEKSYLEKEWPEDYFWCGKSPSDVFRVYRDLPNKLKVRIKTGTVKTIEHPALKLPSKIGVRTLLGNQD
ncbi:hypothetical protein PT283_10130 [Acetobacteraceae bacterium ESL0697]|nr:hypothetical protein [Acetobacteraceae bacterium ESL0697]